VTAAGRGNPAEREARAHSGNRAPAAILEPSLWSGEAGRPVGGL